MVVTTSEAMLSDVIDQGEVAFTKRITAADLSPDGIVYPGVRLLPGGPPLGTFSGPLRGVTEGFGIGIDTTILGKVAIEGSVWLDPSAYVDYDLGWSGLESASYTQTLTTSTDISVSIKQDYSEEKEVTLYEQTLGVITIMAGPWPVFVTPTFKVYVSAEGEVSAGVTAGVSVDTETSVGIGWDEDDGWSPTVGQLLEDVRLVSSPALQHPDAHGGGRRRALLRGLRGRRAGSQTGGLPGARRGRRS